jgi:hypothetical protein
LAVYEIKSAQGEYGLIFNEQNDEVLIIKIMRGFFRALSKDFQVGLILNY